MRAQEYRYSGVRTVKPQWWIPASTKRRCMSEIPCTFSTPRGAFVAAATRQLSITGMPSVPVPLYCQRTRFPKQLAACQRRSRLGTELPFSAFDAAVQVPFRGYRSLTVNGPGYRPLVYSGFDPIGSKTSITHSEGAVDLGLCRRHAPYGNPFQCQSSSKRLKPSRLFLI